MDEAKYSKRCILSLSHFLCKIGLTCNTSARLQSTLQYFNTHTQQKAIRPGDQPLPSLCVWHLLAPFTPVLTLILTHHCQVQSPSAVSILDRCLIAPVINRPASSLLKSFSDSSSHYLKIISTI